MNKKKFMALILNTVIIAGLLAGCAEQVTSKKVNNTQNYEMTLTERLERGDYDHIMRDGRGLEEVELVFGRDYSNVLFVKDRHERKLSELIKDPNTATMLLVIDPANTVTSLASMRVITDEWTENFPINIVIAIKDYEGYPLPEFDSDISDAINKGAEVVGIPANKMPDIGITNVPNVIVLDRDNIARNVVFPDNIVEVIYVTQLSDNRIGNGMYYVHTMKTHQEQELAKEGKAQEQQELIEMSGKIAEQEDIFNEPMVNISKLSPSETVKPLLEMIDLQRMEHMKADEGVASVLSNAYGLDISMVTMQDHTGEVKTIKQIIEEGGNKPAMIKFTRVTCPFCVDLEKEVFLSEVPPHDVTVINAQTRGLPIQVETFWKNEGVERELETDYFNVKHLVDVLKVPYVPMVLYVNEDGIILNAGDFNRNSQQMQIVIDDIAKGVYNK